MRGLPCNRYWAEHSCAGRSGRGPLASPALFTFACLHRLVDYIPDGVRRLPLHPLSGMGIGIQREARRVVAQCVGESLHIHAILQGERGEGIPLWHNKDKSENHYIATG